MMTRNVFTVRLAAMCLLPASLALLLAGCAAGGDVTKPIPSAFYPAPEPARRIVVMLPGIDDNLRALQRRHVAKLIQTSWPHADVVLTGLTLPFYKQGRPDRRLKAEVIARYRKPGEPLWLAGISLGGMGVLFYDRQFPDEAAGMLLFSPYLGDAAIHKKIRAAGGLAHWNPRPRRKITPKNFQRQLWRYLKGWRRRPQRTAGVWLAYGASGRFRKPIEMVTPMLPTDHVIRLPGDHDWDFWKRAFPVLLKRVKTSGFGHGAHEKPAVAAPSS